ncbi:hypothetical protein A3Q29_21815 [Providencia stuartii]|uniref:DUF4113 domain-containing protein n=1 Tax=Providencia stuartii TaxID=588 RepID=A0A1S1HLD1_PROST|nr:hypothetical protein A3Q29_21815 [Providencia stuartii]
MQTPLFESQIACGFPSPAQDNVERRLSLDAELIRKGAIWFVGQGIQSQFALWKMKQQFLSPHWTTRLSDIPRVRC